ncbi:MAG: hypothetical protein KC776_25230 [Myxococcales bacterium]|nr:hypothetical protein [Myxococcales bacterium]MCB9581817.1 hypothetical protein [Polyangiaceae bacterium]
MDACIAAHVAAQEKRLAGQLLEARKNLRECAAAECPGEIASQCTQWLMELRSEIPSVVIVVRDQKGRDRSDVAVRLDGNELGRSWVGAAVDVDPGKHRLSVTATDGIKVSREFVAAPGESRRRVSVALRPRAPARASSTSPTEPPPYLGYALVGIGAVALGASAALWLSAKSDLDGFKEDCAPTCDQSKVDSAKRKATYSDIALAVGVVGAASGSYLVLSHGPTTTSGHGFLVSASGRF